MVFAIKPSTRNKIIRKVGLLRGSVIGGKTKKTSTSSHKKTSVSSNTQTTEVAKRTSVGMKNVRTQDAKYKNIKKTSFSSVTTTSDLVLSTPTPFPTTNGGSSSPANED